jgi:hypothetical protein
MLIIKRMVIIKLKCPTFDFLPLLKPNGLIKACDRGRWRPLRRPGRTVLLSVSRLISAAFLVVPV